MDLSNVYIVILAGGSGTRFWPKSRTSSPKQLCQIGNSDKTMIELTLDRVDEFIPADRRIIVTHKDQISKTKEIVGDRVGTYLPEPEAKNTANALALAAFEIHNRNPNAVMISLHADHLIPDTEQLQRILKVGANAASKNWLTLIGIQPTHPETGYGYIEKGDLLEDEVNDIPVFKVKHFKEKPNAKKAQEYLESGNYFWNSGLFVWSIQHFLNQLETYLPKSHSILNSLANDYASLDQCPLDILAKAYSQLENISIDHAILEKSSEVAVVKADLNWKDVGSWDALEKSFPVDKDGNFIKGEALLVESKNCTVETDGPLIAVLGMEDVVVVHSKGAILVCPKDKAQSVKKIVESLKAQGRSELT